MQGLSVYLTGGVIGFGLAFTAFTLGTDDPLIDWVVRNLGYSTWAFITCLALFMVTLYLLHTRLQTAEEVEAVSQMDQLSDIWIHVFVGIGVVWTAIGMRSALVSTLSEPAASSNAAHVLERLVDGGILLALSTTIVGAIGGYAMRVVKTVALGSRLSRFYAAQDREQFDAALQRLKRIEGLLEELTFNRRAA